MKLFLGLMILIISSSFVSNAQSNLQYGCQSDSMSQVLLQSDPNLLTHWIQSYHLSETNAFTYQSVSRSTPYTIPVVVHVVHFDGSENISDEQIRNGIDVLTRNFRKQNPDTNEIVADFKPIAADMEIEFRLATIDPNGNCTNGINRIRSPLTTVGDHTVKELIHWPRNKYVNLYIVRNAAGLAGHALMPFQADSIPHLDGIVISGDYMGNIGTSNQVRSVVLSHEMGHFLNLYHIWGGNNVPGFYYLPCALPTNCAEDDGVFDTPNTIGWQSCNLSGASCGNIVDNVQNFMDYAYCARMFTEGQKQRVHAALNSSVAQRNELWTLTNIAATGVDVPAGLCKADFKINRHLACVGDSVQFSDASYHQPSEWSWHFGDMQTSLIPNPKHAYTTPGRYDVSLTVGDGVQSVSKSMHRAISIIPSIGQSLPFQEDFEYRDSLPQTGLHLFSEHQTTWQLNTLYGSNGHQSAYIACNADTQSYQYAMYTPGLDLTEVQQPVFSFTYAFAKNQDADKDMLKVKLSKDCGQYWITRLSLSDTLPTAPHQANDFTPNTTQWKRVTITNIPSSYFTSNVIFKIEFTSSGGNHLYIDEINVYDHVSIGTTNFSDEKSVMIFPNPGSDFVHINATEPIRQWQLLGADGKMLMQSKCNDSQTIVNVNNLSKGIYFFSIQTDSGLVWKKWMCR